MGNGNYWLTEAEWQRIEEPLLQLDPAFEEFAKQFDLQIKKKHKGDPSRSVEWGKKIRLLIQVYLENPDNLTFNLWLCASQDREGKRYWKTEMPVQGKVVGEFQTVFASLLNEGKAKLETWSEADLEFVTNVETLF